MMVEMMTRTVEGLVTVSVVESTMRIWRHDIGKGKRDRISEDKMEVDDKNKSRRQIKE